MINKYTGIGRGSNASFWVLFRELIPCIYQTGATTATKPRGRCYVSPISGAEGCCESSRSIRTQVSWCLGKNFWENWLGCEDGNRLWEGMAIYRESVTILSSPIVMDSHVCPCLNGACPSDAQCLLRLCHHFDIQGMQVILAVAFL